MAKLLTWQIGMISQFCKKRLFFLIERIVWAHCILFYLLYHSFRNVYRFFFVLYRVLQTHSVQKEEKKMENLGTDSITSRMQSGRSTIWANPPARKIRVISWMIWEWVFFVSTHILLALRPLFTRWPLHIFRVRSCRNSLSLLLLASEISSIMKKQFQKNCNRKNFKIIEIKIWGTKIPFWHKGKRA